LDEFTRLVIYIITKKTDLITVYHLLGSTSQAEDIDVAILKSLLKGTVKFVFNCAFCIHTTATIIYTKL